MNTDLNIKMLIDNNLGTGFIKKHMKLQSLMSSEKMTRGDKSFARMQSETAQVRLNKGFIPLSNFKEANTSFTLKSPLNHPLKRTTSDLLSKININNIKNTETFKGDVIRSMGIEIL